MMAAALPTELPLRIHIESGARTHDPQLVV